MQSLVARQDLVNMIINQCHLEQGWDVSDYSRIALLAKQLNI